MVRKAISCPPFADHLREVLGVAVDCAPWSGQSTLPLLFKKRFTCWTGAVLGQVVLFAVDEDPGKTTPAQIATQIGVVRERFNGSVVYVCAQITALHRLRLIQQRVPFVVPGKQVYLPPLGIDLREHFSRQIRHQDLLSPGAQVLVLAILLDRMPDKAEDWSPTQLAQRFGYGAMTMVRAFDDLAAAGLILTKTTGRRRTMTVTCSRRELWDQAQPRLRTPVLRTHLIAQLEGPQLGSVAGLTALARQTMLADPGPQTVAVAQETWQSLAEGRNLGDVLAGDPNAVQVQIWSYDPALFGHEGVVDPLSLILSLHQDEDDRTRMACTELLEKLPW
jgi:DNA-binding MarR family transcriptional regulator